MGEIDDNVGSYADLKFVVKSTRNYTVPQDDFSTSFCPVFVALRLDNILVNLDGLKKWPK